MMRVIGAVLLILCLPVLLVVGEALDFYTHNRNNGSIVSSGEKREYLLYVPHSYDPSKPAPLVISMHGADGWPTLQMEISQWNRLAERERFIVVYPSGADTVGPRVWGVGTGPRMRRDVRFISELIDKIEADYNIDRQKIYANGFSNGGGMTFVLSCTLSDRIAAFGMVGAAQTLAFSWCKDDRPVPLISFHGTADKFAFYNGGQSWIAPAPFPAVQMWTKKWARRNRCRPDPIDSVVAADVTRREYASCANHGDVVLYTIHGGGHQWFGGEELPEFFVGKYTRSIDATSVMWAFFRAHPLAKE